MALLDPSKIRRCPSLIDASVLSIGRELFEAGLLKHVVVVLGGNTKLQATSQTELNQLADDYELGSSRIIHLVKFYIKEDGQLDFRRQIKTEIPVTGSRPTVLFEPSTFESEFEFNDWPTDPKVVGKVLRLLDKVAYGNGASESFSLPNEFLSAIGTQVQALTAATSASFDDVRRLRSELETELSNRREELDKTAAERERIAIQSNEKVRAELDKEREHLDARIAEVDNSENKHARRELRAKITEDIQSRLLHPIAAADIARHRGRFFMVGTVAAIIPAAIIGHALYEISVHPQTDTANIAFTGIRLGAASAAFLFLVFYMLSFLKKISEEDSRSQRQVERYSLDIDRASWVIETVLEVQSRENSAVPKEWLVGVTTDMFGGEAKTASEEKTALEAFGEILQTGVELEVSGSGGALKLNPKSAKRIGKSGTSED